MKPSDEVWSLSSSQEAMATQAGEGRLTGTPGTGDGRLTGSSGTRDRRLRGTPGTGGGAEWLTSGTGARSLGRDTQQGLA